MSNRRKDNVNNIPDIEPINHSAKNKNNFNIADTRPKRNPVNKQIIVNFIDSFFKENHHNFYILKTEVDINELLKQLKKFIKIFRRESLKIPLRIDPRILELCESGKDSEEKSGKYLRKYFTNNKNEFKELYNRTNHLLTSKNGINMRNLLRISNKNNSKIATYLKTDTSSELKKNLYLKYD